MKRSIQRGSFHAFLFAGALALACEKDSGGTTPPDDGDASDNTGAGPSDPQTAEVPPAVAELEPIAGAKPLGAKMWRRFGKGEWTAHTFFVPSEGKEVTLVIDMEGGGEALIDPFKLMIALEGLEVVEGTLEIPGQVPPGMKRRERLELRASGPGIMKIRFATVKEGAEAAGPTSCLKLSGAGMTRCTGAESGGDGGKTARSAQCCAKGKNDKGEDCAPIEDKVDAIDACSKSKKFALVCDGEITCAGKACSCK